MGVFKEEARTFEEIENRSKQIFNDACDYGFAYNSNRVPKCVNELVNAISGLKNSSLCKKYEKTENYTNVVIEIAWEIDEGMECGTRYTIFAHKLKPNDPSLIEKGNNVYVSVDSESYRKPYKRS
jgi:hypothetical protein